MMTKTEIINKKIEESNEELKRTFVNIYGTPSQDELLKLSAMKDLFNMSLSSKRLYIRYYDYLKKIVSDSDYEENRLTSHTRIDYNLTLIKLLSMYGGKIIENYNLFSVVEFIDSDNLLLKNIGNLFVLLEAFNKIKVSEYSKYAELFFDRPFINKIYPRDYANSNEAIEMISHNLDNPIKRYCQDYEIYDDNNRKRLVKSIISDIDARKRVFNK